MRVPNNSKFACQKGQIELYFNFKAKNLSKNYIFRNPHDAIHHTLNKNVPSTNNLIEQYYKISFRHNLKKIFRS